MKTFITAAALSACACGVLADGAGLQIARIDMPHHGSSARVAIWYPAQASGEPELYAGNPVFQGVPAYKDAEILDGHHPVILFSHGMGGTDRAQAWLASALAERGAITVLVNHPNSTWGDFDMAKGVAHWTRAQDLSAAFDVLLDSEMFKDQIDMSRIMAAGFSYGGWTALSLGGVRGNLAGSVESCEIYQDMEACDVLMSDRVNMAGQDPQLWNAHYADPRVTHIAAIDPGFVWGLTPEDVEGLVNAPLLIGFGGPEDRMLATDFDQSGLSGLIPSKTVVQIDPAYHFSAMPLCQPAGEAILKEENDDPVCSDPVGSKRAEVHEQIIELISAELGL